MKLFIKIKLLSVLTVVLLNILIAQCTLAETIFVSNVKELMDTAKKSAEGHLTVIVKDGVYIIPKRISIKGNYVTYKSASGSRDSVVIKGKGPKGPVSNIFSVKGNDFHIEGITIGEVKRHAIQIHGESNIKNVVIRNVHFYDTGEQMIKGSYDKKRPNHFITNGLIENCLFEFTHGKAFQFYTAGIDIHHGINWLVKNSVFKNINNPDGKITEGAIHFWNHSKNIVVSGNTIVNCDRGILFGMDHSPMDSGFIVNNFIHTMRDTGIYLCNATNIKVLNNTVFIDSNHPNAIEYRFKGSNNITIANNLANRKISSRNEGKAKVVNNVVSAKKHWFSEIRKGDLHLDEKVLSVHGKGLYFPDVDKDIDGENRAASTIDIGADQNDDIEKQTIEKLLLAVDKTVVWNDGIDQVRFDFQAIYKSGKIKSADVDSIQCVNKKINIKINDPALIFESPGKYKFQAKLENMSSNIVEIEVRDIRTKQVGGIEAWHHQGQTFLTFDMIINCFPNTDITYGKYFYRKKKCSKNINYKIYRSEKQIISVEGLTPVSIIDSFSGWNEDFYGKHTNSRKYSGKKAIRYVCHSDSLIPLQTGRGIFVFSPIKEGNFFYAVTAEIKGQENQTILASQNTLINPVQEKVGQGHPVLQRVAKPKMFKYIKDATLYIYTKWESPPNSSQYNKPFDYVVAIPKNLKKPAPVGIHLHSWGGNLMKGYAWWNNAEKGAILLSTNQVPYDWWTGYRENFYTSHKKKEKTKKKKGTIGKALSYFKRRYPSLTISIASPEMPEKSVVRPYTINRVFSFLEFLDKESQWAIDLKQTFTAGSSMGGAGSLMIAMRHPERIAWARSWVGVHIPEKSPKFKSSYEAVWGKPEEDIMFEDGSLVWDYFNDAKYLYSHPQKEIGFLTFSNGKNDSGIGWAQAVEFAKALQDTKRPHLFIWGQSGHGQRTVMPGNGSERIMPIDIRTDQSLPAFTNCSLDDDPGNGDAKDGDPKGQLNRWLYWNEKTITDGNDKYEITVALMKKAPESTCHVDITPRRVQHFKPKPGTRVFWANKTYSADMVQTGIAVVDEHGLITLNDVIVSKKKNRIILNRSF